MAKYWGLQPNEVWSYPYRYYMELRGFYLASLAQPEREESSERSDDDIDFDYDADLFRGDSL